MVASHLLLIMAAIIFGIVCATVPYHHNITNRERMNFGARPP
jgi:hypothetical protein